MITEKEIANDIDNVLLKAEILANPFYNDAGGSRLWSEIANKLVDIKNILIKEQVYEYRKTNNRANA